MGGAVTSALKPSPLHGRGWPASAGRVRGRGFERLLDHRPHAVEILKHVMVPEADNAKPLTFEECSPPRVTLGRMLSTIDFNDQPPLGAEEIDNVGIDFDLLAELETVELSSAKDAPEFPLGVGRVLAQPSGSGCQEMVPCHNAPSPRRYRADPLPRRGEGFCRTVNA